MNQPQDVRTVEAAQERPPSSRRGLRRVAAVVLGLLVFFCCSLTALVAMAGVFVRDNGLADALSVDVVQAVNGLRAATSTPIPPTETPAPPTGTQAPTRTPRPTATPGLPTQTPEPTETLSAEAAEADYRQFVAKTSVDISNGLSMFWQQNQAVSEDSSLLMDQSWIRRTATAISMIQLATDEILRRDSVPQHHAAFHEQYVQAASLYQESLALYMQALDEMNADKLSLSAQRMQEANAILKELPLAELVE